MPGRLLAPLIALAASLGLVGVYLLFGGASYDPAEVADPCEERASAADASRPLAQAIVLSALDGAACELGVDREELTLALATEDATNTFSEERQLSEDDVNDAVRSGLIRAVDDAIATGRVDGFEADVLRGIAENAPIGPTVSALQALPGEDSPQAIVETLLEITSVDLPELPGADDIPGLEDLGQLLP